MWTIFKVFIEFVTILTLKKWSTSKKKFLKKKKGRRVDVDEILSTLDKGLPLPLTQKSGRVYPLSSHSSITGLELGCSFRSPWL